METQNTGNAYLMPIAIVLAGLFIGGAVFWNGSHPSTQQTGTTGSKYKNNKEFLQAVTKSVSGVDFSKLEADVTAHKDAYDQAIMADRTEAGSPDIGIGATPSTLVGKQMIAGAYPYSELDLIIKAAQKGTTDPTAANGQVKITTKDSNNVNTTNVPFIGDAKAPLTIAYWTDYQCPFCQRFEEETLPQIIQNYVQSGKVKVVFKDFAFLGPASLMDAEYARAVWSLYPDKYFAWRTAMFKDQQPENSLSI